jgi:hypothetical protein
MIERNFIPWASGYTRLVWRNSPGFESAYCRSLIYLEAFFIFFHCPKIFHLFLLFYTACFLLVKNTLKFSYNMKAVKQLKKYTYHRVLKIILSKANTEDIRLEQLRPGEIAGSSDYAERLLMKFHMEIQSEHFGQGRDLSIEGNVI